MHSLIFHSRIVIHRLESNKTQKLIKLKKLTQSLWSHSQQILLRFLDDSNKKLTSRYVGDTNTDDIPDELTLRNLFTQLHNLPTSKRDKKIWTMSLMSPTNPSILQKNLS